VEGQTLPTLPRHLNGFILSSYESEYVIGKLGPCNAIANLMQLVHLVELLGNSEESRPGLRPKH